MHVVSILIHMHDLFQIRGGPFFGPEKCLNEFIVTWWTSFENRIKCRYRILVHFSIIRIPISVQILTSNRKWIKIGNSNYWEVDQNRSSRETPSNIFLDQKGPSRTGSKIVSPGSYFPSTQIIKNHNFSQKMIFVSLLGLLAGAAIGALVTCACTDPAGSHWIL